MLNCKVSNPLVFDVFAGSQNKCFENYLDVVNLTYFGPQASLPGTPMIKPSDPPKPEKSRNSEIRQSSSTKHDQAEECCEPLDNAPVESPAACCEESVCSNP